MQKHYESPDELQQNKCTILGESTPVIAIQLDLFQSVIHQTLVHHSQHFHFSFAFWEFVVTTVSTVHYIFIDQPVEKYDY